MSRIIIAYIFFIIFFHNSIIVVYFSCQNFNPNLLNNLRRSLIKAGVFYGKYMYSSFITGGTEIG